MKKTKPIGALLIKFAQVAEEIGATTKRLEKAGILGSYFQTLADADLILAARFIAGYIFPLNEQLTTNIGGAALVNAVLAVSEADGEQLLARLVELGDLGDVAAELCSAHSQIAQRPAQLTLAQLFQALLQLAKTSGSKRKLALVIDLLNQATPLEAKYIVKILAGDLRIGLKEGAVEDAIARLANQAVARIQWVNMLTGDIGETALLARQQRLDQAQMRLFHPIKFMLATPAADLTDVATQMPEQFTVEDKFDGIRAQIHIAPDPDLAEPLHGVTEQATRIAIFSRTLDEITRSYPDLIGPLANILTQNPQAGGLILDGEIVPIMGDKILPFQELQKRLGRKKLTPEILHSVPVAFIAYDLLYFAGQILVDEPFQQRRGLLERLSLEQQRVRRADSRIFTDVAALDAEFDAARARGNEGLMIKHPEATYKPGRRGREWLKLKRALATLDVVVTAVEVGNGRRSHLLSDYTFAVRASETDPTLLNVGKAYSGLTDAELQQLSEWFRAHTIQQFAHGKVRVVEPQIVLEVTFDRVQESKRHKGGYALRFPRILRVRDDKPPSEIDTLETVKSIAERLAGGNG